MGSPPVFHPAHKNLSLVGRHFILTTEKLDKVKSQLLDFSEQWGH